MATDVPTLALKISDITSPPEGDEPKKMGDVNLQKAFSDAGFEMADDLSTGFNLSAIGLGEANSGLKARPHVVIAWSDDAVTFYQGEYVPPVKVGPDGRCL